MRLIGALLSILVVGPAFATTTLSSPLVFIASGTFPSCDVTNVSTKPLDVTVRWVDLSGSDMGSITFTGLMPGTSNALGTTAQGNFVNNSMRCIVSLGASAKSVRTAFEITGSAGTFLGVVPVQ
jgi:hypothetical protein